MTSSIVPASDNRLSTEQADNKWQRAYYLWLDEFDSLRTRDNYERSWRLFFQFTGNVHPGEVEPEHVRLWRHELRASFSAATVNLRLSAISSFYKFVNANYAYLRDDNPCEGVKHMNVNPYGKATYLVDDQDVLLFSSVDTSHWRGVRDRAALLLFLTLGVRLDAVASATVDDVRVQGGALFFHYVNKGGDDMNKRLSPNAATAMKLWLAVRGDEAGSLFRLKRRSLQDMIKRRLDAVFGKGHGIHVHSLRHTAAVNADEEGARFGEVMAMLDHKSARVTAVYLDHIKKGGADKVTAKLDKRYGGD